jgi:hypothetical protein
VETAVAEVEKEVEREKVAPGRAHGAERSGGGWATGEEGGEGEKEAEREKDTEREKKPGESVGRGEIMVELALDSGYGFGSGISFG